MNTSPFSRSVVIMLSAVAVALFAASILLHTGDRAPTIKERNHTKPGSYSISAIGYAGFFDILRRTDRPVTRSLRGTLSTVGRKGTLIAAEPDLGRVTHDEGLKLQEAPRLLLVLPKWRGIPDEKRPRWISAIDPAPLITARQTLGLVATPQSDVFRREWPSAWTVNELGFHPTGSGIVQLVRSTEMRPLVGTEDGILLGEIQSGGQTIWVLSDPDIVSNHGIVNGDNAAFAIAMADMLRMKGNNDPGAPIVFDETMHGFTESQPSPLKLLFRFPYTVVVALLCCATGIMLWAGIGRFGAPFAEKPPLDFGKSALLENGAHLLDYGGHHTVILKRYIRKTVRSAAQALHLPAGMDEPALAARLDRIGRSRGIQQSCAAILSAAEKIDTSGKQEVTALFENAWAIYCWKGELLNGYATDQRHRQNRKN